MHATSIGVLGRQLDRE